MTTMNTTPTPISRPVAHPVSGAPAAANAICAPRQSAAMSLLRACSLEDGARWALAGAVLAAAVVAILVF